MRDMSKDWGVTYGIAFDALEEMFALEESPANGPDSAMDYYRPFQKGWNGSKHCTRKWFGGYTTVHEVKDFVNAGWPEGVAKMREKIKAIHDLKGIANIKPRIRRADSGDTLDIDKYLAKDFDRPWFEVERRLVKGVKTHIRLWVNVAYNCNVDPEQWFWRGAVACILTDALENAGYRVEVNGFECSSGVFNGDRRNGDQYSRCAFTFPLKSFNEPLNIDRMAAVTAHASFFRAVVLGAKHACDLPVWSGHGHAETSGAHYFNPEEGDEFVEGIDDLAGAQKFIERVISQVTDLEQSEVTE